MKSYTSNYFYPTAYLILILFLTCAFWASSNALAQTPDTSPAATPQETPSGETPDGEAKSEDGKADEEDPDDGLVAINLKGVSVDNLVKFLAEITGKHIIKHPEVKVKVDVYSKEKVTPKQAFALVSEALMFQGVALVEDRETIKIIPMSKLSEIFIDLTPEGSDEAVGGIIKKIIPIQFADVNDIEALITPLKSPTGTLIVDPTSRKIIITDTAHRVAAIERIIAEVDILDTHQRKVKVFELKNATAEEVAPLLKSVLMTMSSNGNGAGGPPKLGSPPKPPKKGAGGGSLEVVAYKTANSVLVVGSEEMIQAAIELVKEFDREKTPPLSLHTLVIQYGDSDEIARDLESVFSKTPDKRVKDTVEISSDSRSNSLIILSSEENFIKIKDLVAKIDTEDSIQLETNTYEIIHADATDIAEQMNELYEGEQSNSRYSYYFYSAPKKDAKPRFVAETRTNSLIVIARPSEFPKIEEMIKKLDQPINEDSVRPRIFRLKFIDAQEVTDVLNEVFDADDSESTGGFYSYYYGSQKSEKVGRLSGKVNFVTLTATNAIIVMTNNTQNFKIIGDFIHEIDQVSPDAGNTIVVKLKYAQATDLADKLNALYAKQGSRMPQGQQNDDENTSSRSSYLSWLYGSPKDKEDKRTISNLIGQVRVVPDQRTNSLLITTAAQNFALLRDFIEQLDIESPKVLVTVRLLEITTTKVRRVGTRYSSDPSVFESEEFDNGLVSNFGLSWDEISKDGRLTTTAGIDMNFLMQFLQRNADTRVLADTTITMNNNEEGDVFVGKEVPFIKDSQSTPQGGITSSFEYKDVGTTLVITPTINDLNTVDMEIKLEASQALSGDIILGGQVIQTRKFNTDIAVNSGDTIVIGGIMRETQADGVRKVPIIGNIPGVNLLFSKKDKKHEITELIAFITPEILRGENSDVEATEEAIRKLEFINEWRPNGGDAVAIDEDDFFNPNK